MKPLDPRLLRYARSARTVLALGALLGLARTAAIIAWCWSLGQGITVLALPVLGGAGGAGDETGQIPLGAISRDQLPGVLALGLAALLVRSTCGWLMDLLAARGAVRVKAELRQGALTQLAGGGRRRVTSADSELATLLGRGLDALDGYFSQYLPQLILSVVATPLLIAAVFWQDWLSAVTVLVVFPVIPLFMVLIGLATQSVQNRQWEQLQRLSASFLDVVTGLATLKIFRREERQVARIGRESEEYRVRTGRVLRVTFLSGFVLDLAGTFSIALVAVTVGTRIVNGEFPLAAGLFVLLLLPEVFIPIRQVGAAFHASTEGLTAAERVFEVLEQAGGGAAAGAGSGSGSSAPGPADVAAPSSAELSAPGSAVIWARGLVPQRAGRQLTSPISGQVAAGEMLAVSGPSGVGKTTLLDVLRGAAAPAAGEAHVRGEIAWCGQWPGLLSGTVASNVALGDDDPDSTLVREVLVRVGLGELSSEMRLGPLGRGLSGGQAQRVAIARALYRARRVGAAALLLDEPTSALDAGNEQLVCEALREEAAVGRAVVVVSHRPQLLAAADRQLQLQGVTA